MTRVYAFFHTGEGLGFVCGGYFFQDNDCQAEIINAAYE